MKKAVIMAAALTFALAGCSNAAEQDSDVSKLDIDRTTTSDETFSDGNTTAAEDAPANTAAGEESAAEETTPPKKQADPDLVSVARMDTVEVYQQIKLSDFVFDSNAVLMNGDELLDTENLGENEVDLVFDLDGGEAVKKVKYRVVDTTPPVLMLGDDITLDYGTEFDPYNYISYADNCDRSPRLSWDGDVDIWTWGSYPITLRITDSSGNQLSRDITVHVGDAGNSTGTGTGGGDSINFADLISRYSAPGREFGIDVSRWQGEIDFNAVASEGCSFVIIRMGYGEAGGDELDERYKDNLVGATLAGLDVGVYFYSTDTTQAGARKTAQKIVKTLNGRTLDFPVAFDWEEFQCFQQYGMSLHDLCEVYEAFADELEQNGYEAMLYGSKNFLDMVWENRGGRPIWLAHYVNETTYTGDWLMWQRCGTGRIAGIEGDVDLNVFQKSE